MISKTSTTKTLEIFQKEPDKFDPVITDMTMPVMTGERPALKLMEKSHDIPVILCTGYRERILEEWAKRMGI